MPIFIQAQVQCSETACGETRRTHITVREETDKGGYSTGKLISDIADMNLPDGWTWGRYSRGPLCPLHKEK